MGWVHEESCIEPIPHTHALHYAPIRPTDSALRRLATRVAMTPALRDKRRYLQLLRILETDNVQRVCPTCGVPQQPKWWIDYS